MATGVPGLNRELVYSLKTSLPKLPEQRKITEILSALDHKLNLQRTRKQKLEQIEKGLMNELLTGKRRVKVFAEGTEPFAKNAENKRGLKK